MGWLLALVLLLLRATCKVILPDPDPRAPYRHRGEGYTLVILHAHQVAAVIVNDEAKMVAMVSKSADGELLIPSLKVRRVRAVRGSTRKGDTDKGGREALSALVKKVLAGWPGLIAVDGPRGPRNTVHPGAAKAALESGQPVFPTVVIPTRRWILPKTWDRFQIPKPFSTVRLVVGQPITPQPGEEVDSLRHRIADALTHMERTWDPKEAPPDDLSTPGSS